jgi:cation-transporting ATPase E
MTGDGVNDILALKEADCSVAMASGSEATRLVSNLVLLDSNFASMPSVVAEGSRVVNNIQKSSSLFLMKTIYTILLSIFCLIVKTDYPFSTRQVLLLEILVIGIPSFFLALQPNNEKIKGKFITNLLSKSLPGALILFINVIACYVFDLLTGSTGQFITMTSLTILFAGMMVLYTLSKPFNLYRGVLNFAVLTIIILSLTFLPWSFFGYVELGLSNILFIVILVQLSQPIYNSLLDFFAKIRDGELKKKNNKKI